LKGRREGRGLTERLRGGRQGRKRKNNRKFNGNSLCHCVEKKFVGKNVCREFFYLKITRKPKGRKEWSPLPFAPRDIKKRGGNHLRGKGEGPLSITLKVESFGK